MTSLANIIKHVAVSIEDGTTVVLELICTDPLGANVLYDDVLSKLNSSEGMRLWVKAGQVVEGEGAS